MVGDGYGSFKLDASSLARLDRFQHRTAFTFATARIPEIYQMDVTKIAIAVILPTSMSIFGPLQLIIA